MARPPRFTYTRALHHVTLRCNNKEFLFDRASFQLFRDLLVEACALQSVRLHNYCLMTNHVHLLFTVPTDTTLPRFMHRVANRFARRFNRLRGRKGHLWEGRYRSCIVEAPACFLRVMAYIDLNPVRAGMASTPAGYPWSGHRHLPSEDESIISLHRAYLDLADTRRRRYKKYLEILDDEARQPGQSLAPLLFAGSDVFLQRMQTRFGVAKGQPSHVDRLDLGGGICGLKPWTSRRAAASK